MGWVPPTSVHNPTTGDAIPASWGDSVNDAFDWLTAEAPCCLVSRSSTFSHTSSGSFMAITFDQEVYDVSGCHSTVSNTSRLTVPAGAGGRYRAGGMVSWGPSTAGRRILRIVKNGSSVVAQTEVPPEPTGGTAAHGVWTPAPMPLAAGDYLELSAFQSSGGTLAIDVIADFSPTFGMEWTKST